MGEERKYKKQKHHKGSSRLTNDNKDLQVDLKASSKKRKLSVPIKDEKSKDASNISLSDQTKSQSNIIPTTARKAIVTTTGRKEPKNPKAIPAFSSKLSQ